MARDELDPGPPGQVRQYRFKDYFFSYSWTDLSPIGPMRNRWMIAAGLAGCVGMLVNPLHDRWMSFMLSYALAQYPGYLIGRAHQRNVDAQALEVHHLMVWQLGHLTKCASAIGLALFVKGLIA